MLLSLYVKNILLIKEVKLDLAKSFCVITGETGAGKSILLNSLLFCLGQKTKIQKTNLLRPGESLGEVCCVFDISKIPQALDFLKQNSIEINDDGTLIIRRLINSESKTKIIINNTPCVISFLTELGNLIFEFHTQSQQSKLVNESTHDDFLIQYGGLEQKVKQISSVYEQIKLIEKNIELEKSRLETLKRDYDYNLESLKEIKSLSIQKNEELELIEKRSLIKNKEKTFTALEEVSKKMSNTTFRSLISSSIRTLSITDGEELKQKLDQMLELYDEFDFLLQKSYESSGFSENELEKIDDRIHIIRDIARKHRISTDEIESFTLELEKNVLSVENGQVQLDNYKKELAEQEKTYIKLAEELSILRTKYAKTLSNKITDQLCDLGFIEADFIVDISSDSSRSNWGSRGYNKVKFIAKTNKGMGYDSISKIASGGEISRFMLAFKTVFSKLRYVGLIVFDEIDQGVGGQTAVAIANKLYELSQHSQVMLITHQATIAAKANLHIKIYKQNQGNLTTTSLKVLENSDRIEEIARMLFGESSSKQSLDSAKKLLSY
jgi:DNA repair protein RecN (Recombination protein N)